MVKSYYERLSPSDQLAINNITDNASQDDLKKAYIETKAHESYKKRPTDLMDFIIVFALIIVFGTVIIYVPHQTVIYSDSLDKVAPALCNDYKTEFIRSDITISSQKIICKNKTIDLNDLP